MCIDFIFCCGLCAAPFEHIDRARAVNRCHSLSGPNYELHHLLRRYDAIFTITRLLWQGICTKLSLREQRRKPHRQNAQHNKHIHYGLGTLPVIWIRSASGPSVRKTWRDRGAMLSVISANGRFLINRATGQVPNNPICPICECRCVFVLFFYSTVTSAGTKAHADTPTHWLFLASRKP